MFDFSKRTLLLTGAAGGIGRGIAQEFLAGGANVAMADLNDQAATELAQTIDPSGSRTEAIKLEASDPGDVERAVARCIERFGRLDSLVTAAAIFEDHPFETMTDAQWHRTIAANLDSVFYACRRAAPAMRDVGAIVNLASE